MRDLLLALVVVLLAEVGDKSQLIALALASRWRRPLPVLAGVAVAAALLQGVAVAGGAALGEALPRRAVGITAGVLLLVAAAFVLRADDDGDVGPVRSGRSAFLAALGTLLLAELGDKTMIASAALATTASPWAVWVGGTIGFVAADALAVLVGARYVSRLPRRALRLSTAALFAALGAAALVAAG